MTEFPLPGDSSVVCKMEIDFAPSHNPLFGSLSISPPVSMFDSFSPLLHFNDELFDALNPTSTSTDNDEIEDWMQPLLFDHLFEHDLQQNILNFSDIDIKQDKSDDEKTRLIFHNNDSQVQSTRRENEFIDLFHQQSSEQQLPSTTVRFIHQAKLEPTEMPTTLYVSGNELQFHSIISNPNSKTIGHTYTSKGSSTTITSPSISSVPIQPSIPIVPARVLKGKKFKRGGRVTSRATSRSSAAAKRRLNSTAAEPKASVVIIAEDATRIDSKTTTLGLSSASNSETDLLKSSSTTSTRSSTRRRVKSTPREVILFRNGAFISKEPISKQQSTANLCFESTTNNNNTTTNTTCPPQPPPLHQQQITATGLQAAAQIVACNVLRQATLNDALIEQLIKREPTSSTDDDYPIYCYSTPSLSSSSCTMTTAMDEYENSCSTTLKILGCNTTAPLTPTNTTTTTTIELLTFAALKQQQQQQQQQFCYVKQEPMTTTTTTTFLLPRLLTQ